VRDDRERLADVLAAIDRIRRYVQDDRTRFDTDELLQSAVVHWIEIIGEAARGVSDKVRAAHPEVPWRVITDMRNRVSHGYFDIDLDVVWNTVTRDLPKLQESVTRILSELDSEAEDSRLVAFPPGADLAREAGVCVESLFPTVLADGDFAPVDLTSADYAQIADLVNTYEHSAGNQRCLGLSLSPTARANRRSDVGPPSIHGGPAEHADALTLLP
jgi:uncharacterized protein with HEPN domain